MTQTLRIVPPEVFFLRLFSAEAVRQGGVVRRSCKEIDRTVGRTAFIDEVRRRGWHAVENAGQMVVFCNDAKLQVQC